jgi:GNAT superfamily N-acetyltransferase
MFDAPTLVRASLQAGIDALKVPHDLVKCPLPVGSSKRMQTAPARSAKPLPKKALAIAALPDTSLPDMGGNALDAEGVQPHIQEPTPDRIQQITEAITARSVIVPTRSLGPAHADRIAQHLMALPPEDRYLRFGYPASDDHIRKYVEGIDFISDDVFGIYNRKLTLVAVAHLALKREPDCEQCAEFGVSVLPSSRGKGYGSRLFERALIHARNEGVRMLFIQALSENAPMLAIARKHGATLERHGPETEAFLHLAPADWESRLEEAVEDSVAEIDFELKLQAQRFWAAVKKATA